MPHLVDRIVDEYQLDNIDHLARELGCAPATLYNWRAGRKRLTPYLILLIYDFTNYSIEQIREFAKEKPDD